MGYPGWSGIRTQSKENFFGTAIPLSSEGSFGWTSMIKNVGQLFEAFGKKNHVCAGSRARRRRRPWGGGSKKILVGKLQAHFFRERGNRAFSNRALVKAILEAPKFH